ncbi:MAG: glycerate kinase [Opitutaceae bacterium]
MRVLLAFDKFKDALTANQACELAARALREKHPDWSFDLCPLADGGEGFAEILTRAADGQLVRASVAGPRGKTVNAAYGIVSAGKIPSAAATLFGKTKREGRIAVLEMAAASGLALLPSAERDPWHTSTYGTGELMRAAAATGVTAIVLGVGGSATNDLGLGALAALGLQFHDQSGEQIRPPIPDRWREIARISGKIVPPLPPVFIACDVTNPLLGLRGAAAIFGPQKGLRPEDHARMENESARLARMLCQHCGQPESLMEAAGAGAAGGTPFGLMIAAGAVVLPGAELVSTWLDVEARLAATDLVITGEGRFDESSLHGKGPGALAARALELGLPVHVFAGDARVAQDRRGLTLHSITAPGTPLATALREASANLASAVKNQL